MSDPAYHYFYRLFYAYSQYILMAEVDILLMKIYSCIDLVDAPLGLNSYLTISNFNAVYVEFWIVL